MKVILMIGISIPTTNGLVISDAVIFATYLGLDEQDSLHKRDDSFLVPSAISMAIVNKITTANNASNAQFAQSDDRSAARPH